LTTWILKTPAIILRSAQMASKQERIVLTVESAVVSDSYI